jgi:hypothetical protein
MNLYRIVGSATDYDTYDSAVVAAPDAETAQRVHPGDGSVRGAPDTRAHHFNRWGERWDAYKNCVEQGYAMSGDWCLPSEVEATLIGTAVAGTEVGVICASFNAG